MRKRVKLFFYITLLSVFMVTGCGPKPNISNGAEKEKLTIVTSFYPIYIHVINIVKDIPGVEVINMTEPQTGCLHDYQLSPSDIKTLDKADIVVINGGGMEDFMDKVLSQTSPMSLIDASEHIELLTEEHADQDDHNHGFNPHVWVSISGAIEQVEQIAKELAVLDPDHKALYEANGADYITKLEDLSREMHEVLDPIPSKNIVTFHEAFPYFAKEFGLTIVGTIVTEPGDEPSAKQLTQIIEDIEKHSVKAVFTEPQFTSKAANLISQEANVGLYTLDPIVTGQSNQNSKDDYINKMKENLKILEEALK